MPEPSAKTLHNEIIRLDAENQALKMVLIRTIVLLGEGVKQDASFVARLACILPTSDRGAEQSRVVHSPMLQQAFHVACGDLKRDLLQLHDELVCSD